MLYVILYVYTCEYMELTMVVVNSKSPGCNPRGCNSEQIQIHASLVEHGISGIMDQR